MMQENTTQRMPLSLRRELTFTSATAIVVANMIGTGIFTTTGFLAGDLGRPILVVAIWLVGAVVALSGALCYAELGVNFPRSGGDYVYLREAWGPAWGFLSGWVSFFAGFSAPIAVAAMAFSEYLAYFFPSLAVATVPQGSFALLHGWHAGNGQWLAIGIITFFAAVNILGLRLAAKLQNILTGLKLAVLGAFLALVFLFGKGSMGHFQELTARTSTHSVAAQFAVSLIFVMFAYSGWNAATYVAEEIKSPERTLPAALVSGTLLVGALYIALNIAFIYALPLASLKGVVRVGSAAAGASFGVKGGGIFSAIMAIGLLSCVSAMVIVGPRVYYAMAQDGCFFRGAARLHPRRQTPVLAILGQSAATAIMIVTGTFEGLIYYIGFALILFAALAVAGMVRLRRRPGWKRSAAVSFAYPLVPAVFILASAWMLCYTGVLRPKESLLGLATIAGGGLLYGWKFHARPGPSAGD